VSPAMLALGSTSCKFGSRGSKSREICKNGTANIGLCSFAIGPTFHRHRWSHRVIHWEWQIHEWSVFAVLILQFFPRDETQKMKPKKRTMSELPIIYANLILWFTWPQSRNSFFSSTSAFFRSSWNSRKNKQPSSPNHLGIAGRTNRRFLNADHGMLVNPLFISTIHRTCNAPYGCCSQQLVLMMTMAEPGSLWRYEQLVCTL